MRVLLVHQNFPGQFKHIYRALIQRSDVQLRALSLRDVPDGEDWIVDYRNYVSAPRATGGLSDDFAVKLARGTAAARAAEMLKLDGFSPDVILGHPGWGELLFLKEVFPDAKMVSFFEFYYRSTGLDVGFDPEFPASQEDIWRLNVKNAANNYALEACDVGISPTDWQRATYPSVWHSKIEVLHDGIDTNEISSDSSARVKFADGEFRRGDGVVTFVSRNLEPYRGFHVFMRALPRLLRDSPSVRVIFLGADGVSYGKPAPDGQSWKDRLKAELGDQVDWSRVFFLGHQNYEVYKRILQISTVHVYLTYPLFLSWSLLEAMCAECAIVASKTPPVEEVITHGREGMLVNFFDADGLSDAVIDLIGKGAERKRLGARARKRVVRNYDLARVCLPAQLNLLESL